MEELGGLQLAGMGLCPPAIARPKMVSGKGTFHSLNRPIVCITPRKAVVEKRYSLSVGIFSSEGGGSAEGSDLGKVAARGRSPDELRFFLSHFPPPCTSSKPTGPQTAPRSSCGAAPCVSAIRSSAMAAAASRRTTNITTGSGSGGVAVLIAGRPSPFCRCFLCLTPTTACWLAVRRYGGVGRSTAPGKRRHPRSTTPIASPIPPRSAAGPAAWTLPSLPLLFCARTLARVAPWLPRGHPADIEAGPLSWLTPVLQVLWPLRR